MIAATKQRHITTAGVHMYRCVSVLPAKRYVYTYVLRYYNSIVSHPLCACLQECFNSTYGTQHFHKNAEPVSAAVFGETTQALATVAKECEVYLVGGSIPERAGDKVYNTATAFDRLGQMVAKYRKMHLFDMDIPGKVTFKESDTLTGGSELAMFDTGGYMCVCTCV